MRNDNRKKWPDDYIDKVAMGNTGPKCPKCECARSSVSYVRHIGNVTVRSRICGNCGERYNTTETN